MQKTNVTPKQAETGGWPLHRVLPPNFRKPDSANQQRSQFLAGCGKTDVSYQGIALAMP
jgi:hypothetical protein